MRKSALLIILISVVLGLIYFLSGTTPSTHVDSVEKRGPHQGRLLQKNEFQVEVTIFEPEGVPPKFRIYFYDNEKPINPSEVVYEMVLNRINRTENIPFKQEGDYLESTVAAVEPHSFQVKINAVYEGKNYVWEYETYEGRVELNPETIQANGIKIDQAGPVNLEIKLDVMGKIVPNEEVTVHMSPRFPGMVKGVYKKLGDYVHKGETLATIESNESLQNYEVKSEIDGMIIKKDINLGMYLSGQESIFVISDLSSVWGDFNIYRHDLPQIKLGNPIEVTSLDGRIKQQSTISYISPFGNESTQSVTARTTLPNPDELWKPGLFVSGEITVDTVSIPVAIKDSALQTFRDWDVVFIAVGQTFEVVPVQLGRRNKEWVEIVSGLTPGDQYVSENSFILKADLEKSGATHEH